MFLFLYRCNGMDLVTDKNRFAKSVSKPFLKRSASFGSYWEACQPTLHTGPTDPPWISVNIVEDWTREGELSWKELSALPFPSLLWIWCLFCAREKYTLVFLEIQMTKIFRRRSIILDEVILFGGVGGCGVFSIKIQSIIALLNADNIFTITITSF